MDTFETIAGLFIQSVGLAMVLACAVGLGVWYYRNILRGPRR